MNDGVIQLCTFVNDTDTSAGGKSKSHIRRIIIILTVISKTVTVIEGALSTTATADQTGTGKWRGVVTRVWAPRPYKDWGCTYVTTHWNDVTEFSVECNNSSL